LWERFLLVLASRCFASGATAINSVEDKHRMPKKLTLNVDEIVKSHISGWMPAFAGMTVAISV
jgi:hypothetical protein